MPRLRNPLTGSVVNVDEETAERYAVRGYEALDKPKPTKKAAPRKRAAKKSE